MAVAALFVERGGVYFGLPGVDPWDKGRDARLYPGPHPVVAHPPCHLWTNLAHLNYKRYGGEHNRPGNDGGCFELALRNVNRYGGVLEHPAGSMAWEAYGIAKPVGVGWHRVARPSGVGWCPSTIGLHWVCEVWQSAYGHRARKRTWLYYVGDTAPIDADWTREPGTHQCGWFDRKKPTLGKREASRTPPRFAAYLVSLAAARGESHF